MSFLFEEKYLKKKKKKKKTSIIIRNSINNFLKFLLDYDSFFFLEK